ncbi:fasciclin domain-containing protein [Gramella lutea]|uniref:Fasciclin domain-containing protein n=1 Tax=Christiangramia lutea TaxID=1607951 RepID=A0A9X1V3B5_9FLAO|nr:fasciclin domain-containing protein [Christiangramia lutea]MCH4823612.1 fasciclin domain-containing protein [Christiangramia lutea]
MKFILKNAKLSFLALFIFLGFTACDEEDDFQFDDDVTVTPDPDPDPTDDGGTESNNILDFAAANGHTTFVAAAEAAGLTDVLVADGEITVFMPTNDAFQALLDSNDDWSSLDDIDAGVLELVLMNHVQDGSVMSTDLSTGYIESMAAAGPDGENVSLYVNTDDGVMLNGMSSVTSADNDVDNGVVHVVDGVIGLPDVTTFATADPTFSILVQALTREDSYTFIETLQGEGPFTVFAPTDDAFLALLDSNDDWSSLDDIDGDLLADVLSYHVVAGDNVTSDELSDGMVVTTFLEQDITINVDADGVVTITDANDGVSTVVAADVQATNGVIHAIDMVLLPSME